MKIVITTNSRQEMRKSLHFLYFLNFKFPRIGYISLNDFLRECPNHKIFLVNLQKRSIHAFEDGENVVTGLINREKSFFGRSLPICSFENFRKSNWNFSSQQENI